MSTALLRAPDRHAHGVRPDDRHRRAPGSAHGHSPPLAADLLAVLDDLAPEVALEADSEAPAPVIPEAEAPPEANTCTDFVIVRRRRL